MQYNYGAIVTTPIWNGIHPPIALQLQQKLLVIEGEEQRISPTTSIQCFLTWDIYLCPAFSTSTCYSPSASSFSFGVVSVDSWNEQKIFHPSGTFGLGVWNRAIKIQFLECQQNLSPNSMDKYRSNSIGFEDFTGEQWYNQLAVGHSDIDAGSNLSCTAAILHEDYYFFSTFKHLIAARLHSFSRICLGSFFNRGST